MPSPHILQSRIRDLVARQSSLLWYLHSKLVPTFDFLAEHTLDQWGKFKYRASERGFFFTILMISPHRLNEEYSPHIQSVISTVWYTLLPHDWLTALWIPHLAHRLTLTPPPPDIHTHKSRFVVFKVAMESFQREFSP